MLHPPRSTRQLRRNPLKIKLSELLNRRNSSSWRFGLNLRRLEQNCRRRILRGRPSRS